jgi:hypothetical protein
MQIGNHRAQLNVGDGAIILAKQHSCGGNQSRSIMVRVENVDLDINSPDGLPASGGR